MGGGRGKWVGVAKHTLPQHPNLKLEHYNTFHSLIFNEIFQKNRGGVNFAYTCCILVEKADPMLSGKWSIYGPKIRAYFIKLACRCNRFRKTFVSGKVFGCLQLKKNMIVNRNVTRVHVFMHYQLLCIKQSQEIHPQLKVRCS